MSRREYSEADRSIALAALAANGGNVARTMREVGVSRERLVEWRDSGIANCGDGGREGSGTADDGDGLQIRECKMQIADGGSGGGRAALADRLEHVAHLLIDAIPAKLPTADLRTLGTCLGLALDKMRILREEPAATSPTPSLTEEERAERISELLQRAVDRHTASAADGDGAGGAAEAGAGLDD